MREIRTSGSVGAWGGKPLRLPDPLWFDHLSRICFKFKSWWLSADLKGSETQ